MKVAFSLTQFSHSVPGGTGVAARELWTALTSGTHPIDLVSVGALGVGKGAGWELPEPSKRYRLPYPALYELWNRTDRGAIDRLVPDADVAHFTLAFCPARGRIPQVVTVHDVFPITHPQAFSRRGARVMLAGLGRVLERADIISTISQASADALVREGAPKEKLRIVPWGATADNFTDTELDQLRQRLQLPERFVMFAGTVEPRKNLDILLAAIDQTESDVHLVLVGPAGWGDINDRVASLPADRVHVLGWQSRRDLLGLMTIASAVAMPSLAEGFGLPALEAMAQGTPVLHSECPALREVVGETGRQIDSTDAQGWATAMTLLVGNDDLSGEMGLAAKDRASGFTWQRCADAMRAVYEELS